MQHLREKFLLLLLGGVGLGSQRSLSGQWKLLKTVSREWKKLDKDKLRKEINYLYRINIVDKEKNNDGSIHVILTEKGTLKALNVQLKKIKNQTKKWDGKWRMVAFDMPERYKRGRDALRRTLKEIGFREFQKSVFICPYDCIKEISLLVEYFHLDKYVRLGVLEFIDNESHFKKMFQL